jgi:hypothetical protein
MKGARLSLLSLIWGCSVALLAPLPAAPSSRNPIAEPALATIDLPPVAGAKFNPPRAVGVLTYQARVYPVTVRGLNIVTTDHAQPPLHISVYGLTSLAMIDGRYTPVPHPVRYPLAAAVLQNNRGVELRLIPSLRSTLLPIGPSGIRLEAATLSIEEKLPPPVFVPFHPFAAWFGFLNFRRIVINPTLDASLVGFAEGNAGFGGHFDLPIDHSHEFFEHANEAGLDLAVGLPSASSISGRVSGIFSMTGGGINATGDPKSLNANDYGLEDANLQWRSGDLIPALGHDALTLSAGPQNYQIGDGFLFMYGATNGGGRGALWLWPRTAFKMAGVIRLATRGALLDAFYLEPNDQPHSATQMTGVNLEIPLGAAASTGLVYAKCFHSNITARDGLNLFYWRGYAAPLPQLPGLSFQSSFAAETNGAQISDANGWYLTSSYEFDHVRWTPIISYRYASFSGGGQGSRRNFDPLFAGSSDWGTWFQGEILGNWLVSNSNLDTHQVRLEWLPRQDLTLNLIYYKFILTSTQQTIVAKPLNPVTSKDFADEIDLIADLTLASWWSLTASFATAIPDTAAKQMSGGTSTWLQGMLASTFTF